MLFDYIPKPADEDWKKEQKKGESKTPTQPW